MDKHCGKNNDYTLEERARIGSYTVENRCARVVEHCSKVIGKPILETTAKSLKLEYLLKVKATCGNGRGTMLGSYCIWQHRLDPFKL